MPVIRSPHLLPLYTILLLFYNIILGIYSAIFSVFSAIYLLPVLSFLFTYDEQATVFPNLPDQKLLDTLTFHVGQIQCLGVLEQES